MESKTHSLKKYFLTIKIKSKMKKIMFAVLALTISCISIIAQQPRPIPPDKKSECIYLKGFGSFEVKKFVDTVNGKIVIVSQVEYCQSWNPSNPNAQPLTSTQISWQSGMKTWLQDNNYRCICRTSVVRFHHTSNGDYAYTCAIVKYTDSIHEQCDCIDETP
jgi:hypothetical protein